MVIFHSPLLPCLPSTFVGLLSSVCDLMLFLWSFVSFLLCSPILNYRKRSIILPKLAISVLSFFPCLVIFETVPHSYPFLCSIITLFVIFGFGSFCDYPNRKFVAIFCNHICCLAYFFATARPFPSFVDDISSPHTHLAPPVSLSLRRCCLSISFVLCWLIIMFIAYHSLLIPYHL